MDLLLPCKAKDREGYYLVIVGHYFEKELNVTTFGEWDVEPYIELI